MKKFLIAATIVLAATFASAQSPKTFKTLIENPVTGVKNQYRSGTCWDFATLGFFESEILRKTGKAYDLCEMFVVNKDYMDNATHYVRMHGYSQISEGGSCDDVLEVLRNYGICPEDAMPAPGSLTGDSLANFKVFFPELEKLVKSIVAGEPDEPAQHWKDSVQKLIDSYVGVCPRSFEYEGRRYTPKSFAASLGLDFDEYVSLTSYSHHPFNEWFVIEAPYKWRLKPSYNIPVAQMMDALDHALEAGYTVAWGGDVSGAEFNRTTAVAALAPGIVPTQQMRQSQWDNWDFTYDHVMLIYGKAVDEAGNPYYMVKNSWGESGPYKGTWYMSRDYMALNTTYIFLNRNALPEGKDNYNLQALKKPAPYYKIFSEYDKIPNGNGWSYWYIPTEVADTLNIKVSELNRVMASHDPHSHDHHEYFLILEGDAIIYLNGEETLLHPGDGFMCPGESSHALRRVSAEKPTSYMMFTLETPGGLGFTPPYFKSDYKSSDCYFQLQKKDEFWYLKPEHTLGGLNIQSVRIKEGAVKSDPADGRQVAYVILEGTADVTVDGVTVRLPAPAVGYVPAGSDGSVTAVTPQVRFLKVRTH